MAILKLYLNVTPLDEALFIKILENVHILKLKYLDTFSTGPSIFFPRFQYMCIMIDNYISEATCIQNE